MVILVSSFCNSTSAFAAVFSKKKPIFSAKVAKTSVATFVGFFNVRARALQVLAKAVAIENENQPESCKVLRKKVTSARKTIGVLFRGIL